MRTVAYKELLGKLPVEVQQLAEKAFQLFEVNPRHPALRWHELEKNHRGSHRNGSFSVSITMMYRAIYVRDGDQNIWYWIGTHADYNALTGRK